MFPCNMSLQFIFCGEGLPALLALEVVNIGMVTHVFCESSFGCEAPRAVGACERVDATVTVHMQPEAALRRETFATLRACPRPPCPATASP